MAGRAMTDCSAAPDIFIPPWGEASKGVRAMVMAIRLWADARGSIDCSEAELAAMTGYEVRAVERHMKDAVKLGFVSRSERRRGADGRLSGYRYWLSAKLNGPWVHPTNCRVDEAATGAGAGPVDNPPGAVDKPVSEPPDNLDNRSHSPPDNLYEATRQPVHGADKLSGGSALEKGDFSGLPRERARAFPLPLSLPFLSFPWRDEDTKRKAGDILAVCGEGLGQLDAQGDRVLKSLAYVLEPDGLWAGFDLSLDVLPVVKLKTGPGRSSLLWDFALLTENLERHRAKRLRSASAPRAAGPKRARVVEAPVRSPEETRAARIETLRHEIRLIDAGNPPEFLLPKDKRRLSGAWRDDAFAALRAAHAEELAGLENSVPASDAATASAPVTARAEG